jgi:hypothetical protein
MIGLLIHILIALLVLGIFWVVIEWAIGQMPLPPPIPQVIRIVFVIVVLIVILYMVMPLLGVGEPLYR